MLERFFEKAERIRTQAGTSGHFLFIARHLKYLQLREKEVIMSPIRALWMELLEASQGRGKRTYDQVLDQILRTLVSLGAELKP